MNNATRACIALEDVHVNIGYNIIFYKHVQVQLVCIIYILLSILSLVMCVVYSWYCYIFQVDICLLGVTIEMASLVLAIQVSYITSQNMFLLWLVCRLPCYVLVAITALHCLFLELSSAGEETSMFAWLTLPLQLWYFGPGSAVQVFTQNSFFIVKESFQNAIHCMP